MHLGLFSGRCGWMVSSFVAFEVCEEQLPAQGVVGPQHAALIRPSPRRIPTGASRGLKGGKGFPGLHAAWACAQVAAVDPSDRLVAT